MNAFQETLYTNLTQLVNTNEAFFYTDVEHGDSWFRIFNYRLASYTDFLHPGALECRGHMFKIPCEGAQQSDGVELVSLPFPKFFNLNENPFTTDLNLQEIVEVSVKMDGSLISSFMNNGKLCLKSKGSLHSDQAKQATELLYSEKYDVLRREIDKFESQGYTVIMEYCSPSNRIVIGYQEDSLTILGIRSRLNGQFIHVQELEGTDVATFWTDIVYTEQVAEFVNEASDVTGIEGYVCRLPNGTIFKVKGLEYVTQHRAKDSINSDRRLYEAVLAEATDDLRSLFHDDAFVINRITEMEQRVDQMYNHLVDTVERFYVRNKDMDRKTFALLGQKELDKQQFTLVMKKYVGRDVNYKEYMAARWKQFGIVDDTE